MIRFSIPSILHWLFGRNHTIEATTIDQIGQGATIRRTFLCATKPVPAPHPAQRSAQFESGTVAEAGRAFSFFRRNPLGIKRGSSALNRAIHSRRRRILGTVLERRGK